MSQLFGYIRMHVSLQELIGSPIGKRPSFSIDKRTKNRCLLSAGSQTNLHQNQ
jgi:hypothetical protein